MASVAGQNRLYGLAHDLPVPYSGSEKQRELEVPEDPEALTDEHRDLVPVLHIEPTGWAHDSPWP